MDSCGDLTCYNFNKASTMYCDKCIQKEIDNMSYQELVDLYIEGKEWIDQLQPVTDDFSKDMLTNFKNGWFALLNIALLSKIKDES